MTVDSDMNDYQFDNEWHYCTITLISVTDLYIASGINIFYINRYQWSLINNFNSMMTATLSTTDDNDMNECWYHWHQWLLITVTAITIYNSCNKFLMTLIIDTIDNSECNNYR